MRVVYWVTEPGQERWLYVGRTALMYQRMMSHYSSSEWATSTCLWTATARIRDDLAVRLEQYLVAMHQPRHNVYLKPDSGVTAANRDIFWGVSTEDVDAIMDALDKAEDVTRIQPPPKRKPRPKASVAADWEQFLREIRAGKWRDEFREVLRECAQRNGRAAA